MKKKNLLIFIMLGIILIFSGCSSNGNSKQNGFDLGSSFKGGDKGLTISFDNGLPPNTIKDQGLQPFTLRVLIQNDGEYDIPANSSYITISGFDKKTLNLKNNSKTISKINGFKVQGSNQRPGGKQAVTFTKLKYLNSAVSGTFPIKINANICYPYETKSIIESCISGNTIPAIDNKFNNCKIEESKKFANSGAPVKISNVKQYSNGEHSIQIQFDIIKSSTNSKFGTILALNSIDSNCNINGSSPTSYDSINYKNKVRYNISSGIPGLDCEGTGKSSNEVLLSNGKYTVNCVQDTISQGDAYNKLIEIRLDYDYLDRISKIINIEHVVK